MAEIIGDTTFILSANKGFESLGIGVFAYPFREGTYILDFNKSSNGSYDNSPQVDDIYTTDSIRTGQLIVKKLDKPNFIIEGSFHFDAFNPIQDTTVSITNGNFRLKYHKY